jgi:hypothetical protein
MVSLGADSVMLATIAAQELETARRGAGDQPPAGDAGGASTPYG